MSGAAMRQEHDLLGDRAVPEDAYFGIHSVRAVENFPITGTAISIYPEFIRALASVKQAAAMANRDLGLLAPAKAEAIIRACEEIRSDQFLDQFIVDVIQGGAGTSTNMNANEVIANRGLEHMGHRRGEYGFLHPIDDVNMSQSTNDVYPTAVKIALQDMIQELVGAMGGLRRVFETKSAEFADLLKMGRTQLQDAVPMTLGQEFKAFAIMLAEDEERLREASLLIREINLGATAIGTGITSHPDYASLACAHLATITAVPVVTAADLVEATQDAGAFVQLSGVLKRVAVKLSKTCNDLRLLSSGPRAGLGEINLPPVQAGSSIMPGKVNPVIPEVVNQVAFQVIGNDLTITMAAEAGQLQLNVMEPILAFNLFQSMDVLTAAVTVLTDRCVKGITANPERCREMVERSIGIVTAVVPALGYERASQVAREALETGRPVRELILAKGWLEPRALDELLSPEAMTRPRPLAPGPAGA